MWTFEKNPKIPLLSWCASISFEEKFLVHVIHGERVEVGNDVIVEGSWDGKFKKKDFDISDFFMGSGGKKMGDTLLFSTPSHTHERLYSIEKQDKIYISNSLPLLLNVTNLELDNKYKNYEKDFDSILAGLDNYKEYIPLMDAYLRLHYFCNIIIDKELNIAKVKKKSMYGFKDYKDYYNRILTTLNNIVENAQDDRRNYKYGLVTTISKGYDATACAALAKKVGCNTALTFDSPQSYSEDNGINIAKKLGYKNIITKNAHTYLTNENYIETQFLASAELGNGIVFSAFENEFKGNLVVIGERGDQIWDKNKKNPNNGFVFPNANVNSSLGEHRLITGYIFLPISLFGISEWVSIHKISNSEEMESYSIGGDYDRPIPRRIAEESGIPREMFGQKKKGAGFNYKFDNRARLKQRMSPKSYEDFINYYEKNKERSIKNFYRHINFLWKLRFVYISYVSKKLGIKLKKSNSIITTYNPGASSFLFKWSISKLQSDYKSKN